MKSAATTVLAIGLFGAGGPAEGATSKQTDVGVRAIAMGGAFVAVANDASALNWNPAAIAALQRQEIDLSYADRFGLGLTESYMGYVLPLTESHAIGLDWFHRGFNDVSRGLGLDAGQNRLGIAYMGTATASAACGPTSATPRSASPGASTVRMPTSTASPP